MEFAQFRITIAIRKGKPAIACLRVKAPTTR
jgi:hypothetical protein